MITLTPLGPLTVPSPFGNLVEQPDADSQLVYNYLEQFAKAINDRVANPADATIVIPTPTFPTTYSVKTPFGAMTFQYKASTILTLNALSQIAAGINADWNS